MVQLFRAGGAVRRTLRWLVASWGRRPAGLRALRISLLGGSLWASVASAAAVVGQPAPTCAASALGERPLTTLAQLHGKVVYLDFWASWCGSCAKAFPHLNALRRELAGRGFEILAVNLDERSADAQVFLDRHPVDFALAADAAGTCPRAFGVKAMPSGYLIDRTGTVRQMFSGFRNGDELALRSAVLRVLDEPFSGAIVRP